MPLALHVLGKRRLSSTTSTTEMVLGQWILDEEEEVQQCVG
jgi:hypothetical protein